MLAGGLLASRFGDRAERARIDLIEILECASDIIDIYSIEPGTADPEQFMIDLSISVEHMKRHIQGILDLEFLSSADGETEL